MSREWLDYAWADGPTSPSERIVFLCLADHANVSGQCFPSRERLATLTCLSRTSIFRTLASLQEKGWLAIESGVGRGKFSTYQLVKRGSYGTLLDREKGPPRTLLDGEKGPPRTSLDGEKGPNGHIKGSKYASLYGLTKDLTKSKSKSVNGSERSTALNEDSPKLRPALEPSPPIALTPPDPLRNPEILNLIDLIVCASPWAVLRSLHTSDVTPRHRVAVLTAAKLEADKQHIPVPDALRGLLAMVSDQVGALPPSELRFQGDVEKYFAKCNYRIDAAHLAGKENRNGRFKSKAERHEETLRKFLGPGSDRAGVGIAEFDASSRPRTIRAASLPKRVM